MAATTATPVRAPWISGSRIGRGGFLAYFLGAQCLQVALALVLGENALLLLPINIGFVLLLARRRLHDCGSHALYSLLLLIPLVNLFALGYLLIEPGTAGENRYGPPSTPTSPSTGSQTTA